MLTPTGHPQLSGIRNRGRMCAPYPLKRLSGRHRHEPVEPELGPVVEAARDLEGLVDRVVGRTQSVGRSKFAAVDREVRVQLEHRHAAGHGLGSVHLDLVVVLRRAPTPRLRRPRTCRRPTRADVRPPFQARRGEGKQPSQASQVPTPTSRLALGVDAECRGKVYPPRADRRMRGSNFVQATQPVPRDFDR